MTQIHHLQSNWKPPGRSPKNQSKPPGTVFLQNYQSEHTGVRNSPPTNRTIVLKRWITHQGTGPPFVCPSYKIPFRKSCRDDGYERAGSFGENIPNVNRNGSSPIVAHPTKYNVLVQASASMLTQANSSSDVALMLIR